MTPRLPFFARPTTLGVALIAGTLLLPLSVPAAESSVSPAERQRQLIATLQSSATPAEKAITCKRLAIYGTKEAIPALAPLLADPDLSSWARIALEAIPGPEADAALRGALAQVNGRLLIGVVNSIGYRRDARAVDDLAKKLRDSDAGVVGAAAVALGRIGGETAAQQLSQALGYAPTAARAEVAEGCIRCAERFLAAGKTDPALKLYETVRQANVPKHKALEATRGAILARKSAGLPLLLEQLRSADKAHWALGLRTARELQGSETTRALVAELEKSTADRQALLLAVLGDRGDATVLPAIAKVANAGPREVKLAAVTAAERLGTTASVPVLLDLAAQEDRSSAQAAKTALTRLPGQDVEADLLARLNRSSGKQRQALIEVAGSRQMLQALPAVRQSTADPDAGIRAAAASTLGAIGEDKNIPDLITLLQQASSPRDRAEIEKALLVLSSRHGTRSLPYLLPLSQSTDVTQRQIALHALASVGGPEALSRVQSAVQDASEPVQDEAVRTLSTWANNWPEDSSVAEPLLTLARSGKKESHRVLALRGYLEYLRGNPNLEGTAKVAKIGEIVPLLNSPDAKRSAISVISTVPIPGALESLRSFAADPTVAEEAYSATATLAAANDLKQLSKDQRQAALQWVLEKSKDDTTRRKADEALKRIR